MPQFNPEEERVAIATFPTKPAGLECTAELWLASDMTKVATSDEIPFIATGEDKSISLPITLPGIEGAYPVYLEVFSNGQRIAVFRGDEDVVIAPAVIGFTVTLINCPIDPVYGTGPPVYFTDGTGTLVPCGSPGNWTIEHVPFVFSIDIYSDLRGWPGVHPDWRYITTYSFSATVENGKDYIYDCATREFGEIAIVRMVRAYWKGTGVALYLWENGLTFNGKRAVDPMAYIYGELLPWALKSTFIIPINATITQIEFKLLGVYGYVVCFDYKWTDQKPGEAEIIIAQGTECPPYSEYPPFTHYTVPI